jgi:hypothetical protein
MDFVIRHLLQLLLKLDIVIEPSTSPKLIKSAGGNKYSKEGACCFTLEKLGLVLSSDGDDQKTRIKRTASVSARPGVKPNRREQV